jgi:hypothetical protein
MSRGAGLARHTNFALAFGLRGIPISANLFSCILERFLIPLEPNLCAIKLGWAKTGTC